MVGCAEDLQFRRVDGEELLRQKGKASTLTKETELFEGGFLGMLWVKLHGLYQSCQQCEQRNPFPAPVIFMTNMFVWKREDL